MYKHYSGKFNFAKWKQTDAAEFIFPFYVIYEIINKLLIYIKLYILNTLMYVRE